MLLGVYMKFFYLIVLALLAPLVLTAKEVVLITGATQGIGLTTTKELAAKNYTVYATHRPSSNCDQLDRVILESKGRVCKIEMDVTESTNVIRAVEEIIEKEGQLDILINNAAFFLKGAWESCDIDQAKLQFEVNYFGPMRLIQAVLPIMREQKRGRIINITGRAAFRPLPSSSVYSASKAALFASSETLAFNVKPWNIKVSVIEPGPVQTDMVRNAEISTRFNSEEDPYLPYFKQQGLTLKQNSSTAQPTEEVVAVILETIQAKNPNFRYQTSPTVKKQASLRARDITGQIGLKELEKSFKLPS